VDATLGIDYSMSCPAMCLRTSDEKRWFWFSTSRKTPYSDLPPNVSVYHHTKTDVIPRAHEIAMAVLAQIAQWQRFPWNLKIVAYGMEDYAYAATGQVFHIGEHAGVLKYNLFRNGVTVVPVAPTQAKKFGHGKGNADKVEMTEAFFRTYPVAKQWPSIFFDLNKKKTIFDSPLTDLADAFWIAEYVWVHRTQPPKQDAEAECPKSGC
jgi:hypothetical protein